MRVFVTGATGVVGPAVLRQLVGAGADVVALTRRADVPLPPGVGRVVGDLDSAEALARGCDRADAVVHLAALLHVVDPPPELVAEYERVNVGGTERLATAAERAGVGRFVYASTINVYGPSAGGAPWTEEDPPAPQTAYAQTKLDAEAAVRGLAGGVALRLAAVYGPGMKGNYRSLAALLRRGLRVLPGDGTNRRTLVHVEDAAAAFMLAASGGVPPGLYNLTDGGVHTFDSVVRSIQRAVGRRPGIRYVPAGPVRVALGVPELLGRAVGRSIPTRTLLDKLTEDVAVSGDALVAASPYRPQFASLDKGWIASGLDDR